MTDVQGRCPACGGASLFLGDGGHVTCSRLDCPDPSAVDNMLGEGAPMLHRVAVLASNLFMEGKPGPERETARKFLAALQRSEPNLLECGFCYEEQGEEVHPHPECPIGSATPALREQIAAVIAREFGPHKGRDYGLLGIVPRLTDELLAVILPGARITATPARMSEAGAQRVIDLYERWVKAGPPPLGVLISRWWDARLIELHNTIQPPQEQKTGCRCHNGDELCSGCHQCPDVCNGCDGPEYSTTDRDAGRRP